MMNNRKITSFLDQSTDVAKYIGISMFAIVAGFLIYKVGLMAAALLVIIPIIVSFFIYLMREPRVGIIGILIMGFLTSLLTRYFPGPPFGLSIDALLILTIAALFIKNWKSVDFSPLKSDVVLVFVIWMSFIMLQLVNPLAVSLEAWFFAMRGIALYKLLAISLGFLMFNKKEDFKAMLYVWFAASLLGALWGLKQSFLGVSATEQAWLDAGADETHVLFGQLRVFSYYFDAGTYGSAMGHASLASGLLAIGKIPKRNKIFFIILSFLCLWGMLISGTRGAFFVPVAGGLLYLIISKNFKILIIGAFIGFGAFAFLKYTTLLNGNYQVNRLRTALDPQNASLIVRLENRKMLSKFLKDKPLGGGIGSAGFWGQRFSPGTFLADFETDGLYTRMRAETGIVGRNLYIFIMVYVLIRGCIIAMRMPHNRNRQIVMALVSGYAGLLAASYGNSVITQVPTSMITYFSIVFIFSAEKWEVDESTIKIKKKSLLRRIKEKNKVV